LIGNNARDRKKHLRFLILLITLVLGLLPSLTARGAGSASEFVGGAEVPIPSPMIKAAEQQTDLIIPGFQGGQVAYRGDIPLQEVIAFYRAEMQRQGWTPYAALVSARGLLIFTKENQSVLIVVSESNGLTTLAILAGTTTSR